MALHYEIVGKYHPQLYLVGSNTVNTGIKMFGGVSAEIDADFTKPAKSAELAYWVIPDTKGTLQGILHYCRRSEFCKDAIVLVSKQTPTAYLDYLAERHYDYYIVGETKVDLHSALKLLSEKYGAQQVLADTGRILSNVLLEQHLVSELSLLVHPVIVGNCAYNMVSNIAQPLELKLRQKQFFDGGYVWLTYDVMNQT
jgi:2,5-diamino-6-(ribosylamino)-4(3H)-pyrimidinone 5'-phosphate reductase